MDRDELRQFLRAATGHRFFPLLWLTALTGMRRSEVLGLRWEDIDLKRQRLSLNRGLVSVGYEVHQARGKTRNARRTDRPGHHDADGPRRVASVAARRDSGDRCRARRVGVHRRRRSTHPSPRCDSAFERIARRTGVPIIRLHELCHTHGTLLIKARVPVKVVSERLGHGRVAFTIATYQHVLSGMQADAARRLRGPRSTARKRARGNAEGKGDRTR